MIESISIRNFQRHRKLDLTFAPGVTTLTGPSRAGKSSVLRALRWVLLNRPAGDAMIRHGKSEAVVVVGVDGHAVGRGRSTNGKNHYMLNGTTLKPFGVPDAVAAVADVGPDNFAGQHDPPFWLTLAPPELARRMNAVINLGAIDAAMTAAATAVRRAKAVLDVTTDRYRAAVRHRDETAWAVAADVKLRKIDKLERQIEQHRANCATMAATASEWRGYARTLTDLSECVGAGKNVVALADRADASARRAAAMAETAAEWKRLAQPPAGMDHARSLLRLHDRATRAADRADQMGRLATAIRQKEFEICQAKKDSAVAKASLRAVGEVACPTCGQAVPDPSRLTSGTHTSASDDRRRERTPTGSMSRPAISTKFMTLQNALAETGPCP